MSLSTFSMIHIGAEVVIVGGLTFYLSAQIGKVRTRVEVLETRVAGLEKTIAGMARDMSQLASMIMGGVPASMPPGRAHAVGGERGRSEVDSRIVVEKSSTVLSSDAPSSPAVISDEDLGEPEVDEAEADAEFEELQRSRARSTALVVEGAPKTELKKKPPA